MSVFCSAIYASKVRAYEEEKEEGPNELATASYEVVPHVVVQTVGKRESLWLRLTLWITEGRGGLVLLIHGCENLYECGTNALQGTPESDGREACCLTL
jgi:hypothetical protein